MPKLSNQLSLDRCPHCGVAKPLMRTVHNFTTHDHGGHTTRNWQVFACTTCGGAVLAGAWAGIATVTEMYPEERQVESAIPDRARSYLKQAIDSLHAPAGAVMLAASAIDAMLKEKEYTEGRLYDRIKKAQEDHLITAEMEEWAHEVRLDANDERHADLQATLPTREHAIKCVDFAEALGEFLFVLPSKVTRGLSKAKETAQDQGTTQGSD